MKKIFLYPQNIDMIKHSMPIGVANNNVKFVSQSKSNGKLVLKYKVQNTNPNTEKKDGWVQYKVALILTFEGRLLLHSIMFDTKVISKRVLKKYATDELKQELYAEYQGSVNDFNAENTHEDFV